MIGTATAAAGAAASTKRIDTAALKLAHPIEEVVAGYGIELKRQGHALVARCPFHADQGRPNLHLFTATRSWFCFRCGVGGDVLKFVMLAEDLGFLDAVERLAGASPGPLRVSRKQFARPAPTASCERGEDELAVLQAAVSLYHNTLLAEPRAMKYLLGRGLDAEAVARCRLGYAPGGQLAAYLRWLRLPIGPALRVGLLTRGGAEFLAGRILVPDLSNGRPTWVIGRGIDDNLPDDAPVHLGLPGAKPLLGLDEARGSPSVVVTEGSFDYLTLKMWGYPAVATLGTHLRSDLLDDLRGFQRQYLVLDSDDAGFEATLTLQRELGSTAIPVGLPDGIKDPSQLAALPGGREAFAATLLEAVGVSPAQLETA
jgi:DNA primase